MRTRTHAGSLLFCLPLCLLTVLATPLHAAEPSGASQAEVFQHVANEVMLPLTQKFATAAADLHDASRIFFADKSDLKAVQQAWRQTQAAWQPLEALQIGPTIERRTQRHVNAWPMRLKLLAPLMKDASVTPAQVEVLGVSAKGLPALEYLLFPDRVEDQSGDADNADATNAASTRPLTSAHCNLMRLLAAQVQDEVEGLARDWREPDGGFARQLAQAGGPQQTVPGAAVSQFASADQAMSDLVNLLIAGLDAVKIRKVGKPLEQTNAATVRERIESWRAGTSLDHIRDNLRGFELVFFGAGGSDDNTSIGLDDYLVRLERPGLARIVREQLNLVKQALAAIRPPLPQAMATQRQQVEQLHTELRHLQHLMETEIADALQVDLGFNANDGD